MTHIYKLALIALLSLPATAGQPITVIIDGQAVGTLSGPGAVYNAGSGTLEITTREGVYGCQQDVMFRDRLEP